MHFERFEKEELLDNEERIRPLYHVVCMMWARSTYYGLNTRMKVLFRMINNLMIECAIRSLEPSSLFQGEPDESLQKLGKVINVLEGYKDCFKEYRDKLPSFVLPGKESMLWTFRPKDIFVRFDLFMNRLNVVRDIFDTANEFYKVEKIELGGLKGRTLSRGIQETFQEFKNLYVRWSQIQFDALDPTPTINHFEKELKEFLEGSQVLERKLASILVQAFDECYTMESIIKLIIGCGSLLQRPIIYDEIRDKLENMINIYESDLDMVKEFFDDGFEVIRSKGVENLQVDRGFPPTAGALTWIKKMRLRIVKPTEDLPNIEFKDIFESEEGVYTMSRLEEMCTLLDTLENEIFEQWRQKVIRDIQTNMEEFLLKLTEDGLLELNFHLTLSAALKEVKMLMTMGKQNIPDISIELYGISDSLWVSCIQSTL